MSLVVRLQKLLSSQGIASRRKIELLIKLKKIKINGKVAKLGDHASIDDSISIDGRLIDLTNQRGNCRIIIYHKPVGEVCTHNDELNRKTVFESLPLLTVGKWIGVGRLDINTSGLYFFTNDGVLANYWMKPTNEIKRVYLVRAKGKLTDAQIEKIKKGIKIDGEIYNCDSIFLHKELGANNWYKVAVHRGRNHEIRKTMLSQGLLVNRLIRIQYGEFLLPAFLKVGQSYELNQSHVKQILNKLILKK